MKTLLTPVLFVLFSICSLKAQTTFGVKGGLNLASINIDNISLARWCVQSYAIGWKSFFSAGVIDLSKRNQVKGFFLHLRSDIQHCLPFYAIGYGC